GRRGLRFARDASVAGRPIGAADALHVPHVRARHDYDEREYERGDGESGEAAGVARVRDCGALLGGDRVHALGDPRAPRDGRRTTAAITAATNSIPPITAINPPSPISPMPIVCSSERIAAPPSATLRC